MAVTVAILVTILAVIGGAFVIYDRTVIQDLLVLGTIAVNGCGLASKLVGLLEGPY